VNASRLERLRTAMEQAGLDAVALNPGPTLTYMTGVSFHLMERPVVLLVDREKDPVLVLPEFESVKAGLIPYRISPFTYGENPAEWEAVFRKAVAFLALDGRKIGVDPRQMRLLEFRHVQVGAPKAEYPDASEALASLRLRKEPEEVEAMRRAVKIAETALGKVLPAVRAGMTEKEIASELLLALFRGGSDSDLPFAPIVCAGPNSANPHATPSERKLEVGDLLIIDWGASTDGYVSDLTRTFAIGKVDPQWQKIAATVLAANEAGRAAGRAGVPAANVDKAARQVIEAAGYGDYFTHRTGHGLGMEGHEEPYMRGDNMQMLYPGMAYTVEPGIYLAGKGGVRIEDDVVVTADGVDVLSTMPRELKTLG
jgi:Xaa-Pro dipeptidase